MDFESLQGTIPEFAKDLRLNLRQLGSSTALTPAQVWGVALASAIATRDEDLVRAVRREAGERLDEATVRAAGTAASLMGMNNVYYRSTHLLADHAFATLPARLRMQAIARPGVEKADFELMCLAVSAIHGCGKCLDAHAGELDRAGVTAEGVQDAVRIASILHGVALARLAGRTLAPVGAA